MLGISSEKVILKYTLDAKKSGAQIKLHLAVKVNLVLKLNKYCEPWVDTSKVSFYDNKSCTTFLTLSVQRGK